MDSSPVTTRWWFWWLWSRFSGLLVLTREFLLCACQKLYLTDISGYIFMKWGFEHVQGPFLTALLAKLWLMHPWPAIIIDMVKFYLLQADFLKIHTHSEADTSCSPVSHTISDFTLSCITFTYTYWNTFLG